MSQKGGWEHVSALGGLGGLIPLGDVLGIFDLDNTTSSQVTRFGPGPAGRKPGCQRGGGPAQVLFSLCRNQAGKVCLPLSALLNTLMYIGSTSSSGLHHLVYEIVDNSIDEALAGYCSHIELTVEPGDIICVSDNGRGIPVDIQPQTGKTALEVVFTVLPRRRQVRGTGSPLSPTPRCSPTPPSTTTTSSTPACGKAFLNAGLRIHHHRRPARAGSSETMCYEPAGSGSLSLYINRAKTPIHDGVIYMAGQREDAMPSGLPIQRQLQRDHRLLCQRASPEGRHARDRVQNRLTNASMPMGEG